MTQPNIAPQAFKYVCACGGGCRSLEYLDRHVSTAAAHATDPAKPATWYSINGIAQLFGLPEGTHGRLGDFVPQYNTRMGAADFQANVAQWKHFLAERGIGAAAEPNTSPDDICVALTKSTGLRCDRRAEGGADICSPHRARPGRDRITVHPSMVGQVPAPTGVRAPSGQQFQGTGVISTPQTPHVQPPAGVDPVLQSLQAIMGQLKAFDSRITSIEEVSTAPEVQQPAPPAAPVEKPAEETASPISQLLAKLGKS
jgi:hypothetical protein